jgi:hypothetical protein
VILFLVIFLELSLSGLTALAQESQITFHSSANLVLIDVVARNPKSGLPDKTLTRADLEVFDNSRPVSIKTFDNGAQFTTRPLAVWFVVQCYMPDVVTEGSGLFRGQINLFAPALTYLDKQDTAAVAHWCDNGESKLDLLPTKKVEEVPTALEQVLAPSIEAKDHDRTGELALQKSLQLIVDTTRSSKPEPVPVVIFLYGDHSGMPKSEANHFIDELLETSAIAFGLKDRRSPGIRFLLGEQKEVAHYIATQTGGQYLTVTAENYASGLEEILQQLHFRYELGFTPGVLDGKRHKLWVKLTDAAEKQHKGVRLRYRAAYVPIGGDFGNH